MNKVQVYDALIDELLYEFYKCRLWIEITPDDFHNKELMHSLDDYTGVWWAAEKPLSAYNPYNAKTNIYICCNYREAFNKDFMNDVLNDKHPCVVRCTSDMNYAVKECGAQKVLNIKEFISKLHVLKPVEENEFEEIMNG